MRNYQERYTQDSEGMNIDTIADITVLIIVTRDFNLILLIVAGDFQNVSLIFERVDRDKPEETFRYAECAR